MKELLVPYDTYISTDVGYSKSETLNDEMGIILVVAALVIVLVLLLTSRSYAEVPVLLLTFVAAALLMDLTYLAFRYAQTSLYQISYQAPSSVSSETPMTATTVSVGMVMRTSLLVDGAERTFTSFVVAMLSAFGAMASSCTSVGHLAVSRSGVPPRWLEAKMDATVQLLLVTSMATCPL